jgi:hypothetical protein
MKTYAWNPEMNDLLKEERGISFEEIVLNIQLGNEVDIYEHPNQDALSGPENFCCFDRRLRLPRTVR